MSDIDGVDPVVEDQISPLPSNVIKLDTRRDSSQLSAIECRRDAARLRELATNLRRPIANKPSQAPPAQYPTVAVRKTTRAERKRSLLTGSKALAALIDGEVRKLLVLRALLRLAKAVEKDPAALDDPAAAEAWAEGLATLSDFYAVEGSTAEPGQALARFALAAEDLGLVSGDLVFAAGGEMTGDDPTFRAMPIEHVRAQIAEYGAVSDSEIAEVLHRIESRG